LFYSWVQIFDWSQEDWAALEIASTTLFVFSSD